MTQIHLDMFLAAGVGVLALATGHFLTRKVAFLRRFCIPEPVSGGILFSLISLALYGCFRVEVVFDGTIKELCMMIFFTSVGFQSDLRVLRQGGRPLVMLIVLVAVLIVLPYLFILPQALRLNYFWSESTIFSGSLKLLECITRCFFCIFSADFG